MRTASAAAKRLKQRVSIGSIVAFRILFGVIAGIELGRYWLFGWVGKYFSSRVFHFSYPYLSWLNPLSDFFMNALFLLLTFCAFAIALGWFYRISTVLFALGFTYLFLLDKANYVNHFYLIMLCSWLLCLIPAHLAFSFDARDRPIMASDTIKDWCLQTLRFQFAVALLFETGYQGGIYEVLLNRLTSLGLDSGTWMIVIRGLLVLGLFFKPTRLVCAVYLVIENLLKAYLVDLDLQPWLMIAGITLFFDPSWPHFYRRLWPSLEDRIFPIMYQRPNILGRAVFFVSLSIYASLQLCIPLRPVDGLSAVDWLRKTSRFSWGGKPHNQYGDVKIFVRTSLIPEKTPVELHDFLSHRQIRMLLVWPDLVEQFAYYLKAQLEVFGHQDIGVFAAVSYSEDGEHFRLFTNPKVDIAADRGSIEKSKKWIARKPKAFTRLTKDSSNVQGIKALKNPTL